MPEYFNDIHEKEQLITSFFAFVFLPQEAPASLDFYLFLEQAQFLSPPPIVLAMSSTQNSPSLSPHDTGSFYTSALSSNVIFLAIPSRPSNKK